MSLLGNTIYHGGFCCSRPLKIRVISAGGAVVKYITENKIEAISDPSRLKQFVANTLGLDDLVKRGSLEIYSDAIPPIDSKDATPERRERVLEGVHERYALADGTIVLYGTDDAVPLADYLHFAIPPRNPLDLVGNEDTLGTPVRSNGTKPVIVVSSQAVPAYLEGGKFRPIPDSDGPLSMALAIAYIAKGDGPREAGLLTDHTRVLVGPRTKKHQEVLPVFSALDSEAQVATFTGTALSIDAIVDKPRPPSKTLVIYQAHDYANNVLAITHPSQMQFVTNWASAGLASKHADPEGRTTETYEHPPKVILYQMNGIRPNSDHERILLELQDKGHQVYLVPGVRIPPDARDPSKYPVADPLSKIPIVYTTLAAATAKACAALALSKREHYDAEDALMSRRMTQLMTGAWGSEVLR